MGKDLPVNHPGCSQFHKQLMNCYNEYPIRRFTGCCTHIHAELQRCIRTQHKSRQERNAVLAQQRREMLFEKQSKAEDKKD